MKTNKFLTKVRNIIVFKISFKHLLFKARDSKFLLAEEYELEEVKDDDWFRVRNFKENEIGQSRAVHSFMMCFEYRKFKKAIEKNNIDSLYELNSKLKMYELSIIDFPILKSDSNHQSNLLEMAMKCKSYSSFRFLLEQNYESISQMAKYDSKASVIKKKCFDSYVNELREKAEDAEMYEIIDIIDNTVEDQEIADITIENSADIERKNEAIIQSILSKKVPNLYDLQSSKKSQASKKSISNFSNESIENDISKNTKICSIL